MSYNLSKFFIWASPQKRENHTNLSRFSLDLACRKSILKVTIRRPLIHPNFFPEFSPFQQDAVGVYVLYYV